MKQQLCAKKNLLVAKDSVFSVGLKKAAETTSFGSRDEDDDRLRTTSGCPGDCVAR